MERPVFRQLINRRPVDTFGLEVTALQPLTGEDPLPDLAIEGMANLVHTDRALRLAVQATATASGFRLELLGLRELAPGPGSAAESLGSLRALLAGADSWQTTVVPDRAALIQRWRPSAGQTIVMRRPVTRVPIPARTSVAGFGRPFADPGPTALWTLPGVAARRDVDTLVGHTLANAAEGTRIRTVIESLSRTPGWLAELGRHLFDLRQAAELDPGLRGAMVPLQALHDGSTPAVRCTVYLQGQPASLASVAALLTERTDTGRPDHRPLRVEDRAAPTGTFRSRSTELHSAPMHPDAGIDEMLVDVMTPKVAASHVWLPVTRSSTFPGVDVAAAAMPTPAMTVRVPKVGVRLGNTLQGDPVVLDDLDRSRHLYIAGQTGVGKSTIEGELAVSDMRAGRGLVLVDPHGDLIESVLARVPPDRWDDVILVEPDPTAVVAVNLLAAEHAEQADLLISEACEMAYSLWDPLRQGIVGPRWESWMRYGGLLLMASGVPSSFLDVPTLFVRYPLARTLLERVPADHPAADLLREFWIDEYGQSTPRDRGEVLSWFRSKWEPFRTSQPLRRMLGQANSTLSFTDVLANRRILLVNLAKGRLGAYNSRLLGHIVMIRLWLAILERARTRPEDRPPFTVYVDEFQAVTGETLPEMLAEARKYNVGVVLANQFFGQLSEGTRDALMGNVGTCMLFRCGAKDAPLFAEWAGRGVRAQDIQTLPNYQAVGLLSNDGRPMPPITIATLPGTANVDEDVAERVRAVARRNWATPVEQIDLELKQRFTRLDDPEEPDRGTGSPSVLTAFQRRLAPADDDVSDRGASA